MERHQLEEMAASVVEVHGVVAVVLGGSRARGRQTPDSDVDLGLYYEPPLDVAGLQRLARRLGDAEAEVTAPGGWGPWVDGGAWLHLDGTAVDWIYRDVARVRRSWADAQEGRFDFHPQAGHPLGVPDFAYAGELALGVVLADPSGALTALQQQVREYPPALAEAVVGGLWEAELLLAGARKAVGRVDATYVAGCLFRAVTLCAHGLHARAGQWVVNEKGVVAEAGDLEVAPTDFAARAQRLLGALGTTPEALATTLREAEALVAETRRACADAA
ncbi:nucleotidyltransferase domain-containing protein [Intrasporangium sp. YIM S08009]|uniref:nucleotidyltransferase family protein n=1 Tax=Intrasporangium zincisolvens TaxID=3080018 RepID=UPI002B058FA9|nr:nucleotidyltransferase domain-containing protein [Intrasporangium sp. YIM S08009]